MSSITIFDLNPTGTELFQDSESYLCEITNEELAFTCGGNIEPIDGRVVPPVKEPVKPITVSPITPIILTICFPINL